MKVKMLVPMEGHNLSRAMGEEVDVSIKEGKRLIKAEFAEEVKGVSTIENAMNKLRGAERRAAGDAS